MSHEWLVFIVNSKPLCDHILWLRKFNLSFLTTFDRSEQESLLLSQNIQNRKIRQSCAVFNIVGLLMSKSLDFSFISISVLRWSKCINSTDNTLAQLVSELCNSYKISDRADGGHCSPKLLTKLTTLK